MWNPLDKSTCYTLSDTNNKKAFNTCGSYTSVRSVLKASTLKRYFEVYLGGVSGSTLNYIVGVGSNVAALSNYVGSSSSGYGYGSNCKFNGTTVPYGSGYTGTGETIRIAVDFTNGKIWFGRANIWIGGNPVDGSNPAFTFTPNTELYCMASIQQPNFFVVLNCGEFAFTYLKPSKFVSFNYTGPTISPGRPDISVERIQFDSCQDEKYFFGGVGFQNVVKEDWITTIAVNGGVAPYTWSIMAPKTGVSLQTITTPSVLNNLIVSFDVRGAIIITIEDFCGNIVEICLSICADLDICYVCAITNEQPDIIIPMPIIESSDKSYILIDCLKMYPDKYTNYDLSAFVNKVITLTDSIMCWRVLEISRGDYEYEPSITNVVPSCEICGTVPFPYVIDEDDEIDIIPPPGVYVPPIETGIIIVPGTDYVVVSGDVIVVDIGNNLSAVIPSNICTEGHYTFTIRDIYGNLLSASFDYVLPILTLSLENNGNFPSAKCSQTPAGSYVSNHLDAYIAGNIGFGNTYSTNNPKYFLSGGDFPMFITNDCTRSCSTESGVVSVTDGCGRIADANWHCDPYYTSMSPIVDLDISDSEFWHYSGAAMYDKARVLIEAETGTGTGAGNGYWEIVGGQSADVWLENASADGKVLSTGCMVCSVYNYCGVVTVKFTDLCNRTVEHSIIGAGTGGYWTPVDVHYGVCGTACGEATELMYRTIGKIKTFYTKCSGEKCHGLEFGSCWNPTTACDYLCGEAFINEAGYSCYYVAGICSTCEWTCDSGLPLCDMYNNDPYRY